MGLKLWLPLNGTLDNKGTASVTVTNDGATVETAGKIGSCYSFNNTHIILDSTDVQNMFASTTQPFSFACWIYLNSDETDRVIIFGNYNANPFVNWELSAGCAPRLAVGGTSNYTTKSGTAVVPKTTWTHIAVTYDGTTTCFYQNGVLTDSASGANTLTTKTSSNRFWLGSDSRNDATRLKGRMNDFRLYDHCLSKAEVHEIAQGLVLHYKLDKITNNNMFKLIPRKYVASDYSAYSFDLTENLVEGQTYTFQFWDVDVTNTGKTPATLGISIYWGGGNVALSHRIGTDYFTNGHADYIISTVTISSAQASGSGATNPWIVIYNSPSSVSGTKYMHIGAWKVEKGNVGTPWTLSTAENTSLVVPDCSGYGNNGTIVSTVVPTSDTARYKSSLNLSTTTSYVDCGRGGMVTDSITVNMWLKSSAWGNPVSCTEGGGWNFEANGDYFRFPVYIASVGYKYGRSATTTAALCNSQWHMLTGIYDRINQKVQIYVDGKLDNDYAAGTSNIIQYHSSNHIWLGGEATSTGATAGMAGLFSDFRIYATALSADDVKALYQVESKSAKYDNVHAYSLTEGESPAINNSGVFDTAGISELFEVSNLRYDPNVYIEPDGSCWVRIFHHNNPTSYKFASSDTFTTSVYTDENRWFNVSVCNALSTWELMSKVKCTDTSTERKFRWIQTANPMTATFNQTKVANVTRITTDGYTQCPFGGLYHVSSSTWLAMNNGTENNTFGSVGCWTAWNNGIPGWESTNAGHAITTGYVDLFVRIDNLTSQNAKKIQFKKNGMIFANQFIEM